MKKEISILAVVIILFLQGMPVVVADDDMPSGNQDGNMTGEQRGLEHVGQPKKDALTGWSHYFFGKPVDPLDPESMEKYQNEKAERDKRVQAGADFTQAATSLVTTIAPSPTTAAQVGTMVVSEGASAIVDAGTTAPAEKPGVIARFFSWVASWFK